MTIGEKIKNARIQARLTQDDLASGHITRNMLSQIERGRATPSIDTLNHIARVLDIPAAYFISPENDLFLFKKKERISAIKNAFESRNYNTCISIIMKLDTLDDELYFILTQCCFELGIEAVRNGSLESGKKNLTLALEYSKRTMYDTKRFEGIIPLYLAIANNINAPLLEFDAQKYKDNTESAFLYEFYKYLTLDLTYDYTNYQFKAHSKAKTLIKERHYQEALVYLTEIDDTKSKYERNAYVMFTVYSDMEFCYKQLYDFENAYKYASKRLSLLEGFTL